MNSTTRSYPRTTQEAFKDADYAISIEGYSENPKMTFWLPKKALKFDSDNLAVMAKWCTPDEWYWRAENRYAHFYKR